MNGLYVGSIKDSKDLEQLGKNKITHILSVYEDPKEGLLPVSISLPRQGCLFLTCLVHFQNIKYLCIKASDHATQDIKQFFPQAIDFIHQVRINNGAVLVHW